MPRVLRIINRFNLGGPTYNAAYLSAYLDGDYESLLIGGMKDESEDSSEFIVEELGLEARIIDKMRRPIRPHKDLEAYRQLKELIGDYKPDVVHTHASKPGALGRYAAHKLGVPVIVHTFHGHVFHSYFNPALTAFYKRLERSLARISTAIVAISDKQKEELVYQHHICPAEKVEVIPLGFDLQRFQLDIAGKRTRFRKRYGLKEGDVAICIVGRLVPIKNHKLFFEAVKWAKARSKKAFKVFVVGDGELRAELEAYCKSLGLIYSGGTEDPADIHFTSWIKEVDEVNAGCDIMVLSSLNEGTPVSLIEAQAANLPIVSTEVGGISDVVIKGETALLSPVGDVEAFGHNLLKLIDDDELRAKMGEKGWLHVKDKFHYRRLVEDIRGLYDRLLMRI